MTSTPTIDYNIPITTRKVGTMANIVRTEKWGDTIKAVVRTEKGTFIGATNSSSVVANGALAFFTVNVSSKNVGDTIVVNPNFLANFGQALGPNLARIDLLTSPGIITILAVPEPSSVCMLLLGLGTAVMRRRRRIAS